MPFILISPIIDLINYRVRLYQCPLMLRILHSITQRYVSFCLHSSSLNVMSACKPSLSLSVHIVRGKGSIVLHGSVRFDLPFWHRSLVQKSLAWRLILKFWVLKWCSLGFVVKVGKFYHLLCHLSVFFLHPSFVCVELWVVHKISLWIWNLSLEF